MQTMREEGRELWSCGDETERQSDCRRSESASVIRLRRKWSDRTHPHCTSPAFPDAVVVAPLDARGCILPPRHRASSNSEDKDKEGLHHCRYGKQGKDGCESWERAKRRGMKVAAGMPCPHSFLLVASASFDASCFFCCVVFLCTNWL